MGQKQLRYTSQKIILSSCYTVDELMESYDQLREPLLSYKIKYKVLGSEF